jgi:predicted flap endonuclease-1-like 5' DNA nuclease
MTFYHIEHIEGIGPYFAKRLAEFGVKTTADLLEKTRFPAHRKNFALTTGISEAMLLKWANHADLMRVNGIGPQYSELLEASGVDTVRELRQRTAEHLAARMEDVNEHRHLCRATPAPRMVAGWIQQANHMEPALYQ